MAILPIVIAPDPILKRKADPVDSVTPAIVKLMADMLDTMYDAPGIGLAAPQIGVSKRILVMDCAREGEAAQPMRMVNPEIIWASDVLQNYEEGCLSFPEHYAEVRRPAEVKVRYLDETGAEKEIHATGLLAVCVQHEIDHLDGVNFVDHISALKRNIIIRKLQKTKRTSRAA